MLCLLLDSDLSDRLMSCGLGTSDLHHSLTWASAHPAFGRVMLYVSSSSLVRCLFRDGSSMLRRGHADHVSAGEGSTWTGLPSTFPGNLM